MFVHFSATSNQMGSRTLEESEDIEFAVEQGQNGPAAANLYPK